MYLPEVVPTLVVGLTVAKTCFLLLFWLSNEQPSEDYHIPGACGSGPYECTKNWIAAFQSKYPEADFTLSSVGSGAAQAALWGDVDCAKKPVASVCSSESLESTQWGIGGGRFDAEDYVEHAALELQQIPALGGPIIVAYSKDVTDNLGTSEDVQLNMTFHVIAGIFNGTIEFWDHPAISEINPSLRLGHDHITVLVREDKSGMSATFTEAIAHYVPNWPESAVGKLPSWPLNTTRVSKTSTSCESDSAGEYHFKADGQTGIGLGLLRRPHSIGYLELGYFGELEQFVSQVHVASGVEPASFVAANTVTLQTTMSGLLGAMDPATLEVNLAEEDAPFGGYAISRYVYWYLKKNANAYSDCYEAWLLCKFIEWTYTSDIAAEIALNSGWVVPPTSVVDVALETLRGVMCVDEGAGKNESGGGQVISAMSYVPPPYRSLPAGDGRNAAVHLNIIYALAGLVGCVLIGVCAGAAIRKLRAYRRIAQNHELRMQRTIDAALNCLQDVEYPFTLKVT